MSGSWLTRGVENTSNNITKHGSNLDWAICTLHALLLLGVIAWTYITSPRKRVFHYFAIGILTVTTIYYFIMASDLGGAAVPVQFRGGNIPNRTRQVFYTRWVGYFINFALIWFALLLMSGVGWASILFTVGLSMLWASMFLIGMFVRSSYKWGFFVIGYIVWAWIVWQTMGIARSYANTVDLTTHKIFTGLAAWELFLMYSPPPPLDSPPHHAVPQAYRSRMLYPISWAVSEGGNRITNDAEQIFYVVLDVLSQGVFSLLLLFMARKLDFDLLGLACSECGRIKNRMSEKKQHAAGRDGGGTGGPATSTTAEATNGHGAHGHGALGGGTSGNAA